MNDYRNDHRRANEMDIIHVYTREQAVEDGVLVCLEDYFGKQEFKHFLSSCLEEIKRVQPLFPLGELFITAHATGKLEAIEVLISLVHYAHGNWGEVDEADSEANDEALKSGFRLLGAYKDSSGERLWIITEADRSATTVLLPEDY